MKDLIVIGIDAEWVYDPQTGNNKVISYQYAGRTTKGTWSGIIYTNSSRSGDRRRFVDVVGAALEHGRRDKQIPRKWPTNVTVAAHFTRADLSAFKDFANIRKFFDGVGGTFATLTYPYKVNFYDKTCLSG